MSEPGLSEPAPGLRRLFLGAPAAMMLATCVGAQAAPPQAESAEHALQPSTHVRVTPDLGWALQGAAACAVKETGRALAHQAAHLIRTLDQLACTQAFDDSGLGSAAMTWTGSAGYVFSVRLLRSLDPVRSTHQPSAP